MTPELIERTFIAFKHDALQRGLVGEFIKRFEDKGLKLIAIKMIQPTEDMAKRHYKLTPEFIEKLGNNTRRAAESKGIQMAETNEEIAVRVTNWNIKYLTEGPIIAMIWEGFHAIEIGRKIVGHAESRQAPLGTIRGDYSVESYAMADAMERPLRNLVHASGNKEEAENELNLWFSPEQLFGWDKEKWKVMHKV
jgi:nucleoside-diphosphate kinase